ncbi:MAG: alpha/beta fold hydrolase [Anaerolineales bacterium]
MTQPEDKFIQLDEIRLHLRVWQPSVNEQEKPVFLLLHGLSSNARTWDLVAPLLTAAGYTAIAVDQRGHGLSSKPDHGYDFATITSDLNQLVLALGLDRPILVGQSWGGNVVLEAGVRYPDLVRGLVFVDGGFLRLSARGTWEHVSEQLRPPDLIGIPRTALAERIAGMHPGWVPDGVEMTLGNFEHLPDGTVRPWLTLENHMKILRALYDQDVTTLFPRVSVPVLICPADDGSEWSASKRPLVEAAAGNIPDARVRWFEGSAHDIHVDRPEELSAELIEFAAHLV